MFNYIIYTDGFNEIEKIFFAEIKDLPNVYLVSKTDCFGRGILQKIFRIHYSFKINNKITLPFKSVWFRYLDHTFENGNENIYIFSPSWYYPHFFEYLKKKHRNCKLAFHFGDTIVSKKRVIKNLDIDYLKKRMDYVGSYNPDDVENYKIDYLPMCYSKLEKLEDIPVKPQYDLVFIGGARSRYDSIVKCYNEAKVQGWKVYFYITSDTMDEQHGEDFVIARKQMGYFDYLGYVINSKVILEIVDSESKGGTLRFWDAVMYNKLLITNNTTVFNSTYYSKKYITFFETCNELDFSGIDIRVSPNYHYNGDNSPLNFIRHIEKCI